VTTPEQALVRRRLQILDDETVDQTAIDALPREDAWMWDVISRLTGMIKRSRCSSWR
jgi:hypothetical protein